MSEQVAPEHLDELVSRVKRCKCKYCGTPLELRRIVYGKYQDARVEIFCQVCDRIEYGVEPEIYQIAAYFVDELKYDAYPDLDNSQRTRGMNIAKVTEIIAWGCKNLGILDQNGFTVPLNMDDSIIGETLIISESDFLTKIQRGV